ncbi:A/G-specific adenine glycosylase [Gordonia sp. CPCC 205333]|uniref:A/G-specific adenine glycosylase n=1 Tax=Gordonia sp. CPCC 205333 TaxID=3140790 RepID=UPI003AF33C5A
MTSSVPSRRLLGWFDRVERDLPWRSPGVTPWQILVSEIMLQQTPVARVLEPWAAWIERWPTPSALAAAPTADVVRAWGKLGYPRRALRLRECASRLATDYGDTVPADVETMLGLPGIGDYTARAVACFAYGQSVPVVDTNVRRVIARAVHGRAIPGNPSRIDLDDADALAPRTPSGRYASSAPRFSAALMELGALVCTARNPGCDRCPITATCAWVAAGSPAHDGPPPRRQQFKGTDRQVRGLLLDVLRDNTSPVPRERLDIVWPDAGQRNRALDSLLVDGLVEVSEDQLYALPR